MVQKILLKDIAHARSGDKGNKANVGLFPYNEDLYDLLKEKVTSEVVKEHFKGMVLGEVIRYEVPNLKAFNFVLDKALNGGASTSLRSDNLGKCFGAAMMSIEIEVDEDFKTLLKNS